MDNIMFLICGYFTLTWFVMIVVGVVLQCQIRESNDKLTKYKMMQLMNESDSILIRDKNCKSIGYHTHISVHEKEDILVIDLE
jgi:hypothetical protein